MQPGASQASQRNVDSKLDDTNSLPTRQWPTVAVHAQRSHPTRSNADGTVNNNNNNNLTTYTTITRNWYSLYNTQLLHQHSQRKEPCKGIPQTLRLCGKEEGWGRQGELSRGKERYLHPEEREVEKGRICVHLFKILKLITRRGLYTRTLGSLLRIAEKSWTLQARGLALGPACSELLHPPSILPCHLAITYFGKRESEMVWMWSSSFHEQGLF